jgi:hypothetical protein
MPSFNRVFELWSVTEVSERNQEASMQDPSLNLPQEGEVDNRLGITQPHSQVKGQ